jgi:hypothetical protein
MSFKFRIVEHLVPCQHIREYAQATANEQEDVLHLAVKQYIPLDNPSPKPGDITIIGGHANGFVKAGDIALDVLTSSLHDLGALRATLGGNIAQAQKARTQHP